MNEISKIHAAESSLPMLTDRSVVIPIISSVVQ